jgi:hypothetical protein
VHSVLVMYQLCIISNRLCSVVTLCYDYLQSCACDILVDSGGALQLCGLV